MEKQIKLEAQLKDKKRQQVAEMKKKLLKEKEKELKEREQLVQQQYQKYILEKEEREKKQKEELFMMDVEHMKEFNDKNGSVQQKLKVCAIMC